LFTARPSFVEGLEREFDQLSHAPSKELHPFGYADRLIGFYIEKHGIKLPAEDRRNLKKVSEKSFWLLAYALEGYKPGTDRSQWVRDGVRDDLAFLDTEDAHYPEALLALSPLYRSEVLTAETYLTGRLHLDPNILKNLVLRREVTRNDIEGHVFYGLPHSALADAYWNHGRTPYLERLALREGVKLRHGGEYEDYLGEYMTWPTGNRLEALRGAPEELRRPLAGRLVAAGQLPEALREEISIDAIAHCIQWFPTSSVADQPVLSVLADRASHAEELSPIFDLIAAVFKANPEVAAQLCANLDLPTLALGISLEEELLAAHDLVVAVFEANPEVGAELCAKLDLPTLAHRISEHDEQDDAAFLIAAVLRANPEVAAQLCTKVDLPTLARGFNMGGQPEGAGFLVRTLFKANPEVAAQLCANLELPTLALGISLEEELEHASDLIAAVFKANPEVAAELCANLDLPTLAHRITLGYKLGILATDLGIDMAGAGFLIAAVFKANPEVAAELCANLELPTLALEIGFRAAPLDAEFVIHAIYEANPGAGKKLVLLLDLWKVASRLLRFPLEEASGLLKRLRAIAPGKARELVSLVADERARQHFMHLLAEGDS
jgi:hypothetical protein